MEPEEVVQENDTDNPQANPEEEAIEETNTDVPPAKPGTEVVQEINSDVPQVVVPVEIREMTRFESEKGNINIVHEITLGDLLVSTSLVAILIFMFLSRMIRR